MPIYQEVWKLLLKTNNNERFQNSIKTIKKEIYKAYGFCVAKS